MDNNNFLLGLHSYDIAWLFSGIFSTVSYIFQSKRYNKQNAKVKIIENATFCEQPDIKALHTKLSKNDNTEDYTLQ